MKTLIVVMLTFMGTALAQYPPPFCPPLCAKPPARLEAAFAQSLTPVVVASGGVQRLTQKQGKAAVDFVLKANEINCVCLDMEGTYCCKFNGSWICEGGRPGCGGFQLEKRKEPPQVATAIPRARRDFR